jgi:S-adenosylmethionine:tRNA ribosyltransferase-isomerase
LQINSPDLDTSDYTYALPPDKIANYPLPRRDTSKLLVYKEGEILHSVFHSLPDHLPEDAYLVFNDTKVIPARIRFQKETGAVIEIFLLNPFLPSPLLVETMAAVRTCTWKCTIGNIRRWPEGVLIEKKLSGSTLIAHLKERRNGTVEFTWDSDKSFAEIIQQAGETPLPPYIGRKADARDRERYQTVYSHFEGAVAAPTAGLHFTPEVFRKLNEKTIEHDFVTLHVSAGTFLPIKSANPDEHVMHEEQVIVSRASVEHILAKGKLITAVGTTSMRTLESLYWFGVKLIDNPESEFQISQRDPYALTNLPSKEDALKAVATRMDKHGMDQLVGETSIFIRPGYKFKVCQALITNFHQPASTLILLVAAFVGEDWRKIYEEALKNDYRFLSYGDSSLLMPHFIHH